MQLSSYVFSGFILACAFFGNAAAHQPHAQATYLGNEGVLVARGDVKILFDAFYADSYGQYALVPPEISDTLLKGLPPYDGIDAVFVSHVHGDHFTAAPAIAYLQAHKDVRLYGSAQIRAAILAEIADASDVLLKRVVAVDLAPGDPPLLLNVGDIEIDAYAIPHAGGPSRADIQNIAFRVTLDEATTVMHFGDADTADEYFVPYQADFDRRQTDAAFPPYWFLLDPQGRLVLGRRIKPGKVIGVHVPARAAGNGDAWRAEAKGDLFTDPGETREIGAGE